MVICAPAGTDTCKLLFFKTCFCVCVLCVSEKDDSLPGKLSLCNFFDVQDILVVLSLGSN